MAAKTKIEKLREEAEMKELDAWVKLSESEEDKIALEAARNLKVMREKRENS